MFGGQDRKQVPPVKLLDLQNAVFTQNTTLIKRTGYRALGTQIEGTGSSYTDAKGIGRRGDELLLFASGGTYSYRPLADRMTLTGQPTSVVASERTIVKTGTEQTTVDANTLNNVTAVAWTDSRGGLWWSVLEESTGRQLRPAAQLAAIGTQPRVVPVGGTALHIYYADHVSNSIWVAVINTGAPTAAVTPVQLTTDLTPLNVGYDACPAPAIAGAPACIAWLTSGFQTARIAYVDVTGVLGSVITNLPPPMVIFPTGAPTDNTNMGVGFSVSNIVMSMVINAGDTLVTTGVDAGLNSVIWQDGIPGVAWGASPVWRTAGVAIDGDNVMVVADSTHGTSERDSFVGHIAYSASVGPTSTPSALLRGVAMVTRPFWDAGIPYVYLVHDVPFFSVYLLVRITDYAVVSRTMPIIAHGTQVNGAGTWTSTISQDPTDTRKWRAPMLYNEQLAAAVGQFAETGIRWVSIDFDADTAWQSEQLGAGLYLAGACPQHYDGSRWAEAGWHYAPDGPIVTLNAPGGSLSAGKYTYTAWYEEIDAQGEIHRGPTSVPFSITTSASDQVTITGPMYRVTGRTRVRVCVARTAANDAIEFFRVTSINPTVTGPNGYILNDPTVDTWTLVDQMSDATLIGQEPLYTTGGILSNDPAPMAGGVLAVGKNRLFWTDPQNPRQIRYSQELQDGFAVDFAESLKQTLDPFGGDITAIGIMDDAIYPFRQTAVNVIGGPGPLPNPTETPETYAFTPAELVTSDVGCVSPQSLVQTPVGIAFKSSKGIRMLGRDRRVVDIGEDVRGFDAQGITAATLSPNFQRITFLTSSGSTLLYDYQRAQWSRFTNHEGLDGLILGGLYYYLRTDGRVFQETPGLYRDDNSHIPMVIEMAWLKMAGYLQGWQRIWYAQFLGEYRSPHTLRVRFRFNYEMQWSAPYDLDVDNNFTATVYGAGAYGAGPYGSTGSSVYQRRIHIGKECQAIQFQIQDVEQTTQFGAAFELSELVITGGLKGNLYKLPATRSN